jgi:hypothetical protein
MKLSGLRDLNMTNKTNYLPLVIDFGSSRNHNHIGKLLGQKMVDEIDYFVPMPNMFFTFFLMVDQKVP